jgi:glutathione S-transferase
LLENDRMSYTIVGSIRSPFVRTARVFMLANGLKHDFKIVNFLESKEDEKTVSAINPINKVPILIVSENGKEQTIFDSRVIVNYLIQKHRLRGLNIEEENIVSAVYGILDATVSLFLLERDKIDLSGNTWHIQRLKDRTPQNLAFITPWARTLDPAKDWNYPAMALFSYLYWANARGFIRLGDYPELATFVSKFEKSPGLDETDFLKAK